MATVLQPWQILVAAFAGWISRHQCVQRLGGLLRFYHRAAA